MQEGSFITTRYGRLNSVPVYTYRIGNLVFRNLAKKGELLQYLTQKSGKILLKAEGQHFSTLLPCDKSFDFTLIAESEMKPPFNEDILPAVKTYLTSQVKNQIGDHYPAFLNENTFIYDEIIHQDVKILKCVTFNIDSFANGRFFIHFFCSSKLVNAGNNIIELLYKLKEIFKNASNDYNVHLVMGNNNNRKRIDLDDNIRMPHLKHIAERHGIKYLIFNYQVLEFAFPIVWKKIYSDIQNKIAGSVTKMRGASEKIQGNESFQITNEPFLQVKPRNAMEYGKFVIGNKQKASKLSAVYYNGMYVAAPTATFICIDYDGNNKKTISLFKDLVNLHFNQKNPCSFIYHKPIDLHGNDQQLIDYVIANKSKIKLYIVLFSSGHISNEYFKNVKKTKIKQGVYSGLFDNFALSNFVLFCLKKLGGIPAILQLPPLLSHTIFVGIDLGHQHIDRNTQFSTLSLSFVSHTGQILDEITIRKLPLNEALAPMAFDKAVQIFLSNTQNNGLKVKDFIIHRDGRCHDGDIELITTTFQACFPTSKLDIVEIMKSGFPAFINNSVAKFENQASGSYWFSENLGYGILVTADQESEKGQLINPLLIRKSYGDSSISDLISQVYWLAKINIKNLYHVSRLPLTVQLANDAAITR